MKNWILALAVLSVCSPALAQADRERAQLMQLQQQMQKLRQDNAQLTTELQQAKAQAAQLDQLKTEADAAKSEANRLRGSAAAGQQQSRRLSQDLESKAGELARLQGEVEQLKAELKTELAKRDAASADNAQKSAQALAQLKSEADNERSVLAARLKLVSQRSQSCEQQHGKALALAEEVTAVFDKERTQRCEPFTGLLRVTQEQRVQAWRDRVDDARIISEAAPSAASAASKPQ